MRLLLMRRGDRQKANLFARGLSASGQPALLVEVVEQPWPAQETVTQGAAPQEVGLQGAVTQEAAPHLIWVGPLGRTVVQEHQVLQTLKLARAAHVEYLILLS